MAIQVLNFTFQASQPKQALPGDWSHHGVVGSGDLEILLEKKALAGAVRVQVTTPVKGYDHVWQRVLERFVEESGLYDVAMEINDNNATPFVVMLRLRQALADAGGEALTTEGDG